MITTPGWLRARVSAFRLVRRLVQKRVAGGTRRRNNREEPADARIYMPRALQEDFANLYGRTSKTSSESLEARAAPERRDFGEHSADYYRIETYQ